ncbi:hypothetical protein PISMIDRAFT_677721, partial [Pisolithus microcarpus 441]
MLLSMILQVYTNTSTYHGSSLPRIVLGNYPFLYIDIAPSVPPVDFLRSCHNCTFSERLPRCLL